MSVNSRRGPVTGEDIRQLLFACESDSSILGRRDAALVYLLAALAVPSRLVGCWNLSDFRGATAGAKGQAVELDAEAQTLLTRWIAERGSRPGPLFLARPGRAAGVRRLSPSAMNLVFVRRCRDASVPPFTQTDVLRTCSALQCGQWSADCCELSAVPGMLAPGISSRIAPVVHTLRRMSSGRRRTATLLLDLFAVELDPPATALTVPWDTLTTEAATAAMETVARKTPTRRMNALITCLHEVARASKGSVPPMAALGNTLRDWRDRTLSPMARKRARQE